MNNFIAEKSDKTENINDLKIFLLCISSSAIGFSLVGILPYEIPLFFRVFIAFLLLGIPLLDFRKTILFGIAWAQPHKEWNITFTGNDSASSVAQTLDGGYIIAGTTNSNDYGTGDAWLIKVSGEPDRLAIPDQTPATAMSASTEKVDGFGAALAIMILLAVYKIGMKRL